MDRRDAVRRICAILGGTVSGPTLAGVLAGCGPSTLEDRYEPRTLTRDQFHRIGLIADHIIPPTDTPGAKGAGVDRFIDEMLTNFHPEAAREQFLRELDRVDAVSRSMFGSRFDQLDRDQQIDVVHLLDAVAFPDASTDPEEARAMAARVAAGDPPFMRTMKELTVAGYYTSEVGQTVELRQVPFGPFRANVPLDEIGRAWA
jgi:hypothetical protein